MDKVQRAKGGIRKFLKSGRSSNEEDGKESSSQASTSVDTEPPSQTVPEEQTIAESSGTLASREESFANNNWRQVIGSQPELVNGWPSYSRAPTASTDHARGSPEPETPPGSSFEPGTQEKKPNDEEQAKIATPKMEEFLVKLMNDLYKWAETKNDRAVLGWFTTEQSDIVYRRAAFQVDLPSPPLDRERLTYLKTIVSGITGLRVGMEVKVAGHEFEGNVWGPLGPIPLPDGESEVDHLCSKESYPIYGSDLSIALNYCRVRYDGFWIDCTLT